MMSISTTRRFRIVNPAIANGRPVPEGDCADRAVDERRPHLDIEAREGERSAGHVGRSADNRRGADESGVGPADHVRVQHLEQRLEVALARGREEGVEDLALGVEIGVGDRGLALHASAGAARELARRLPKDKPDRLMRYFPFGVGRTPVSLDG